MITKKRYEPTPIKDDEYNNPNMTTADIGQLSEKYMMLFGYNVNLARAIPAISDGLKPVFRRILYTIKMTYGTKKFINAECVGDVIHIHPHGDLGMNGILAKMGQSFSNNVPLLTAVDGCNSGTPLAGDDYAAARYLSMKMTEFANDVLFKDFKSDVNMMPSCYGDKLEPISLPARFPLILLNGTSGIGYTLSSDIVPYNLNELADATIKLLKNPSANIRLIPDSPTGCDLIIRNDSTFVFQSTYDIDNVNYIITIHNTPYMKFLDDINKKLCEIQDSDNPIPEILSANDESQLPEIKYVIRCKPCNLYNVINTLFKRVPGFRSVVSTNNMLVVDTNFTTKQYDCRKILCVWIQNRLKEKHNYFLRQLVSYNNEYNMLEGKAYMLNKKNIDKTVHTIRACENREEIIHKLVEAFRDNEGKQHVTTSQANYISDIPLYNLTHSEYKKTIEKMENLQNEINYTREVIEDPQKIRDVIIDEIKEIKNKYNSPRKSRILNTGEKSVNSIGFVQILTDGNIIFSETDDPNHLSSDITPISGDNVCLIDDKGSFIWIDTNKIQHDKKFTMTSIGRGVMGNCIAAVSNMNNSIVILTSNGRIKYMPINKIPSNASHKPILQCDPNETIVSIMELHDESNDLLIYTSDGFGKRIRVSDLNKVSSVNSIGQYIMKDCDNVSGMFILDQSKPYICYVTRLGRIRINHLKYLNSVKKFDAPRNIIPLSPQDDLVAACCVSQNTEMTLYHADSRVSTVSVSSLPVSTMSQEAKKPKHVPGVKVIRVTMKGSD